MLNVLKEYYMDPHFGLESSLIVSLLQHCSSSKGGKLVFAINVKLIQAHEIQSFKQLFIFYVNQLL